MLINLLEQQSANYNSNDVYLLVFILSYKDIVYGGWFNNNKKTLTIDIVTLSIRKQHSPVTVFSNSQ